MDDLWGDDDLDADVVEECLLATQASLGTSATTQHQNELSNVSNQFDSREKGSFEFKQPLSRSNFHSDQRQPQTTSAKITNEVKESTVASHNSSSASYLQEIEKLKEENKKLVEANLVKTGESSILRADIQNLRLAMERREAETNQQLAVLQKRIQQMDAQHQKQVESSKTEMKFKELELEELKGKCRKMEQNGKDTNKLSRHVMSPNSPLQSRKFPNRFPLENDRKGVFIDANVQTEPCKESCLIMCEETIDGTASMEVLVETLRFLFLSPHEAANGSLSYLLEQLRIRIITNFDRETSIACLHSCKPCVVELVLINLDRVKCPEELRNHLDLLVCWICKVLPILEAQLKTYFLKLLLPEIKRLSFIHVLQLCSALVTHLGLAPVCSNSTGCLLERAALQLKEAYPSLSPEDQFQAAKQLVLTLSATLASPTSENLKKCACIPHLLKTLVVVMQHQIDLEGLTPYAADRRLKVVVQAFRLCQSILNSKVEPWLTFLQSPAEVNRVFSVLTAISLEFPVPKELRHEINVGAFVGP